MFRKSLAAFLAVILMFNTLGVIAPGLQSEGVSFADISTDHPYGDGTGDVDLDSDDLGRLTVQDYDVSNIDWNSQGARDFWTRENMFLESRVVVDEKQIGVAVHDGDYVYDGDGYYTHIFYSDGGYDATAKSAKRIWGYFVPSATDDYTFKVISDDGHYFQLYEDDIVYGSEYNEGIDPTDYNAQWEKYYSHGLLDLGYVKKDSSRWTENSNGWWLHEEYKRNKWRFVNWVTEDDVPDTMGVSGDMQSETKSIRLYKDRVYPMYMEYFNWGGGGKFEVLVASKNGHYSNLGSGSVYAEIANPPEDNGSGIKAWVEDGIRYVHAYDNFQDGVLDMTVWENVSGFFEEDYKLVSKSDTAKIVLKNEYEDYDSYTIQVDLIADVDTTSSHSSGGIGISSASDTWVNELSVKKGTTNSNSWYREFDMKKYGSTDRYKDARFDSIEPSTEEWRRKDFRMIVEAVKNDSGDGYDIVTKLYNVPAVGEDLGSPIVTIAGDSQDVMMDKMLDFTKVSLVDVESGSDWQVKLDNFDFQAVKDLKFDSLVVKHKNDEYILDWQPLEDAQRYYIFYVDHNDGDKVKKYAVTSAEDGNDGLNASETSWSIPDDAAECGNTFFVVAILDDGAEVGSNRVYVGEDVTMSTLTGSFDAESNYLIKWTTFDNDATKDVTYSLYYGDKVSTISHVLPGATDMSKDVLDYTLANMDAHNELYGKYVQLVATYDDGHGAIDYYSLPVKMERKLSLGVEHINDEYVLTWVPSEDADFSSYKIQYYDGGWQTQAQNLSSTTYKFPDTFTKLNDKKIKVVGVVDGSSDEHSNEVQLVGDMTIPMLKWSLKGNQHKLDWSALEYNGNSTDGQKQSYLYYGDAGDKVTTAMTVDLKDSITYLADELSYSQYMDKYMRLKFIYKGISFYSNIVRSANFTEINGVIDVEGDTDQKKFDITWSVVETASYYELYYRPAPGAELLPISIDGTSVAPTRIDATQATLLDIYNEDKTDTVDNSLYLGKEIVVAAVFEIDPQNTSRVYSPSVIPRRITFDKLDGNFNDATFTLDWEVPKEEVNDVLTDAVVSQYKIIYGNKAGIVDGNESGDIKTYLESTLNLTESINDVTSESQYFKKFYKVVAYINGVTYKSNSVYSGEAPVLSVYRIKDDLIFEWPEVENADGFMVYYKNDTTDDVYKVYQQKDDGSDDTTDDEDKPWLDGNAVGFPIVNIIGDNSQYDDSTFKIAAVFDNFEIDSNELAIDCDFTMPVIEGRYNGSGYDIMFKALDDNATSIDVLYAKTEVVDGISRTVYEVIEEGVDVDPSSAEDDKADYVIVSSLMSTYLNKKVLIRQHIEDNPIQGYSNTVTVDDSAIQGSTLRMNQGDVGEDDIKIKVGNRFEAIYDFEVLDDVYKPYFKITLGGNKYLDFDKTTVKLIDFETQSDISSKDDSDGTSIPLKVAVANDEENGLSYVYVYLQDEGSSENLFEEGKQYRLVLSSVTEVTSRESEVSGVITRDKVYEILKLYGDSNGKKLENWSLPYHIADLKDGATELDDGMYLEYDVYWNKTNAETSSDSRDVTLDLFEYDIQMKNKNELPSSL